MIAIRVRAAGARYVPGLASWEGDDGERVLPVVSASPGYTREDAERDGFLVGPTDADRDLAALRRLRRTQQMSEERWREFLRTSDDYSMYAELEEWSTPPRPLRPVAAEGVPFNVADWLVRAGYAEPIDADLDDLENVVAAWAGDDPAVAG